MGLITFLESYYRQSLNELENKELTCEDIYVVKQLLKFFDDLAGEGHTQLNDYMQTRFSCLTRLRNLIGTNGASPFPRNQERLHPTSYDPGELEIESVLNDLILAAEKQNDLSENAFLQDIQEYCQWIGYREDMAYIFLLRDTLLPYVCYRSRHRDNLYPWLISRRFLEDVSGIRLADNHIRACIYSALESGHIQFEDFSRHCKKQILSVLDRHAALKQALLALLSAIPEQRIVVVESGYGGTFPMMLAALDDRVSFRLYTTAPFLQETYREHIFCRKYEDIHKFERLFSHELLLQYSSFQKGKFYVQLTDDPKVREQALSEMRYFFD